MRILLTLFLVVLAASVNVLTPAATNAAEVTYWFSGHVERIRNPSNALPFEVTVGMPFSFRVTYDTTRVGAYQIDNWPSGDVGSFYFTNTAGFSSLLQIAGHTITNRADPTGWSGAVGVYDQYNNSDSYWMESGKRLAIDGNPFLAPPYFSICSLYLYDSSKTALNSAQLPTVPPALASFQDSREFIWGAYLDDGKPTRLFSVEGVVTQLSTDEQVLLNCRAVGGNSTRLEWPAAIAGFSLQSSSDLAAANWQNVTNPVVEVNGQHTVTVPSDNGHRFFRLTK